jgi:hypothetical protein
MPNGREGVSLPHRVALALPVLGLLCIYGLMLTRFV